MYQAEIDSRTEATKNEDFVVRTIAERAEPYHFASTFATSCWMAGFRGVAQGATLFAKPTYEIEEYIIPGNPELRPGWEHCVNFDQSGYETPRLFGRLTFGTSGELSAYGDSTEEILEQIHAELLEVFNIAQ